MSIDLRQLAVHAAAIGEAFAVSGVFETGGPNNSDQINFWQHLAGGIAGESYCCDATFAWYCKAYCQVKGYLTGQTDHDNRVIMLNHADEFSKRTGIARTGSCMASMAVAASHGRVLPPTDSASVGDQVYFDFPVHGHRLGYAHHTGLVLEVIGPATIKTVEANTSSGDSGSQDNGQGCYIRTRSTHYVVGYMHLAGLV